MGCALRMAHLLADRAEADISFVWCWELTVLGEMCAADIGFCDADGVRLCFERPCETPRSPVNEIHVLATQAN